MQRKNLTNIRTAAFGKDAVKPAIDVAKPSVVNNAVSSGRLAAITSIPRSEKPEKKSRAKKADQEEDPTVTLMKQLVAIYTSNKVVVHKKLEKADAEVEEAMGTLAAFLDQCEKTVTANTKTIRLKVELQEFLVNALSEVPLLTEAKDGNKLVVVEGETLLLESLEWLSAGIACPKTLKLLWIVYTEEYGLRQPLKGTSKVADLSANDEMKDTFAKQFDEMTKEDEAFNVKSKKPKVVFDADCFNPNRLVTLTNLLSDKMEDKEILGVGQTPAEVTQIMKAELKVLAEHVKCLKYRANAAKK